MVVSALSYLLRVVWLFVGAPAASGALSPETEQWPSDFHGVSGIAQREQRTKSIDGCWVSSVGWDVVLTMTTSTPQTIMMTMGV